MSGNDIKMKRKVVVVLHNGLQFASVVDEETVSPMLAALEDTRPEMLDKFVALTDYSADENQNIKVRRREIAATLVQPVSAVSVPPRGGGRQTPIHPA